MEIVGRIFANYFQCKCHRIEWRMWNSKSNWLRPPIENGLIRFDFVHRFWWTRNATAAACRFTSMLCQGQRIIVVVVVVVVLKRTASRCIFILRFDKIISVPSAHFNYTQNQIECSQLNTNTASGQTANDNIHCTYLESFSSVHVQRQRTHTRTHKHTQP